MHDIKIGHLKRVSKSSFERKARIKRDSDSGMSSSSNTDSDAPKMPPSCQACGALEVH